MTRSLMRWRAGAEGSLVALATGLFAAGLCFVRPTVFESADYALYWKPTLQFLSDSVRAGVIPLWNPYIGLGRPFLADMQNGVFYPPMYLVCAGQHFGVFVLVWLHCLLGVLGMRRLGAALETGRWQSYFMAACFLASGELTARWMTGQITYCWGLCYLPWLFYFAVRSAEPWQTRRVAHYAICLALQFLCGHPQVFWFSVIGQGVFILTRAPRLPLGEAVRDAARGVSQFSVACIWSAGLAAPVLLPMRELIRESNRAGASAAFAGTFGSGWADLLYLFNPLRAGEVNWEGNLFVGTIAVLLGVAGLALVRERNVRGFVGVLVIGLLIAAGPKTPLFTLFYEGLPGFAGFRLHARAEVLVVFALVCAAGIWLGRPHPRVREAWDRLLGIPIRYGVVALVLLQALDLLQGLWMIKKVYPNAALMILQAPADHTFERTLAEKLRQGGWVKPFQPPPRVCVPPSFVPADYAMAGHYSSFDAGCSLFVRRPWDYLHAMLGIAPPMERGSLSRQVYSHGPFPYSDVSPALGWDAQEGRLVAATNPAPRAFVVYGAEAADYGTTLNRLAHGYDIHQRALLEKPLAEPLRPGAPLACTPAVIRRFDRNGIVVDADARQRGLLVLAEAWYPGWRAEVDGKASLCVPANLWMRAVPVSPGRHQVHLFFRQDGLVPGLVISVVTVALALVMIARRGSRFALAADEPAAAQGQLELGAIPGLAAEQAGSPLNGQPSPRQGFRPTLNAVAAVLLLGAAVTLTEIPRWRGFRAEEREVEAQTQCYVGLTLHAQREMGQAIAHYRATLRLQPDHVMAMYKLAWMRAACPQAEFRNGAEAVRLAQRACELTRYQAPGPLETLAAAYAEAGRFGEAAAVANTAHQMALAAGQPALAERPTKMLKLFAERKPYREADRD